MRNMLKIIREQLLLGRDLVLVTVIAASGSIPRGAGARMLVGRKGRICGTIGGGGVEYRAEQIAAQVLENKSSQGQDFTLTNEDLQNLGMICGGKCRAYFHYLPAGDGSIITLAEAAEGYFRQGKDLWLIYDLSDGGAMFLSDSSDVAYTAYLSYKPRLLELADRTLYLEQICSSSRVYIFGGGHVAQELVPVLTHVGFRCVVLEDRPEFAKMELFPGAEKVLLVDFERIGDWIQVTGEDYVCVMTRGHASDTVIQAQVLPCRPYYCGVVGSRAKAAGVRRVLKEDYGLSEDLLDLVTTPIGLIKGETPAEVAISIAAQLIQKRSQRLQ